MTGSNTNATFVTDSLGYTHYGGGSNSPAFNVNSYGAKGDGITDDWAALQGLINLVPAGSTLLLSYATYLISKQLVINKSIRIIGNWSREKATNTIMGSIIKVSPSANLGTMESSILINSSNVVFDGIAIRGRGKSNAGHLGVLCKSSHGSILRNTFIDGFDQGFKLGIGSAHVTVYDSIITDCNDANVFGSGNLFDFTFINSLYDGNVRSGFFLEANTAVQNVLILRCQMGYTAQYGVLQDPTTTTGDGFNTLSLINSPIEQVTVSHISVVNIGLVTIQGGYWTWTAGATSTSFAFAIKNLNYGELNFNPNLEPSYPNPNCPAVIGITGFTNFNVKINTPLNGFAQKLINFGPTIPIKNVFINDVRFGDQTTGASNVDITSTASDQTVIALTPVVRQNYQIMVYVEVQQATNLTLTYSYNNGTANQTVNLVPAASAQVVGELTFQAFVFAEVFNQVTVKARSSVASAVKVSAVIEPKLGSFLS